MSLWDFLTKVFIEQSTVFSYGKYMHRYLFKDDMPKELLNIKLHSFIYGSYFHIIYSCCILERGGALVIVGYIALTKY